jgi:hypothetical protein
MSVVTNITAFYRELIPGPAEYQNREAHATITVDCSEAGDDLGVELDEAMDQARHTVRTYLGLGGGKSTGSNSKASGSTKPPATSKGNISDNPEDRTDPEEETAAEAKKRKTAATKAKNKAKKDAEEAAAAADDDGDNDFDFDGDDDDDNADAGNDPDAEEVTDDDLHKAANATVLRLQSEGVVTKEAPRIVTDAIKAFKPEDHEGKFGIKSLTQPQRRKFINKLAALKGPEADD